MDMDIDINRDILCPNVYVIWIFFPISGAANWRMMKICINRFPRLLLDLDIHLQKIVTHESIFFHSYQTRVVSDTDFEAGSLYRRPGGGQHSCKKKMTRIFGRILSSCSQITYIRLLKWPYTGYSALITIFRKDWSGYLAPVTGYTVFTEPDLDIQWWPNYLDFGLARYLVPI